VIDPRTLEKCWLETLIAVGASDGADLGQDLLGQALEVVECLGFGTSRNGGHSRGMVIPASW